MASFDENGKYIKTNWKAGDKITSTKLNKIEESIEAVNDNDISRHVEADARLDALEAKDVTHDKELTNIKNTIADNKAAAELGDYEINSRMTFLEEEFNEGIEALNEGIEEVHNVAETVDSKIAKAESDMSSAVNTAKNEMAAQVNAAKNNMAAQVNAAQAEMTIQVNFAKDEMRSQVNTAKDNMTAQVNQGKADMEAMVAEVEVEMIELQNDVSEIQNDVSEIQNDMTNAHTQSFTVRDNYKFTVDHDGMLSSLVTLNNVEGLSSVETNALGKEKIVSRYLKNICTVDYNKNHFEDAAFVKSIYGGAYTKNGTTVNVTGDHGWCCVDFELPTLVEGKKYCILCDNIIVNSGTSGLEMRYGDAVNTDGYYYIYDSSLQLAHGIRLDESGFNTLFICNNQPHQILRLHCCLDLTSGDVTYENIQVYEVKEIIVPDIQLNSLPNGVKDEIKDGVLIKRTGYIPLNTLQWKESSTNVNYPDSPVKVYWANLDNIKLHEGDDKIILCNMFECKSQREHTASAADTGGSAISGDPQYAEVRIKAYKKDAADVESLLAFFNEYDVYMVYELDQPEYIDVNTTIKADKNDIIIVNTCKPLDFTYDIQCSTRAQIDALQEQSRDYDNVISNIKESVEYDIMHMVNDTERKASYTLPGGLIIKAGATVNCASGTTIRINYDTPFPSNSVSVVLTMNGGAMANDSQVGLQVIHDRKGFAVIHFFGSDRTFNYIAIGY